MIEIDATIQKSNERRRSLRVSLSTLGIIGSCTLLLAVIIAASLLMVRESTPYPGATLINSSRVEVNPPFGAHFYNGCVDIGTETINNYSTADSAIQVSNWFKQHGWQEDPDYLNWRYTTQLQPVTPIKFFKEEYVSLHSPTSGSEITYGVLSAVFLGNCL